MPAPLRERKPLPVPGTGLVRGQAAKIARIHRLSVQHVLEVARGNRPADEKLARTITEYREQNTEPTATAPAA